MMPGSPNPSRRASDKAGTVDSGKHQNAVHRTDGAPAVSRRQFMQTAAGVTAAVGIGLPATAEAKGRLALPTGVIEDCSPAPIPIPGGFNARDLLGARFPDRFFNLFLPGPGVEPSTVFHFKGDVAIFDIRGTGTRTELDDDGAPIGTTPGLPFAADVRFMDGDYIGVDGEKHKGTFGFY